MTVSEVRQGQGAVSEVRRGSGGQGSSVGPLVARSEAGMGNVRQVICLGNVQSWEPRIREQAVNNTTWTRPSDSNNNGLL